MFLNAQSTKSFVSFCDSIDPSMGMNKIWHIVRSLSFWSCGPELTRLRVFTVFPMRRWGVSQRTWSDSYWWFSTPCSEFLPFLKVLLTQSFLRALLQQLIDLRVPVRILKPLLFNLHFRCINDFFPVDVRVTMYADDLLMYPCLK